MTTVRLPARMTTDDTYLVLRAVDEIEKLPKPLEIDASACEWFSPLGTTLLALAIARRVAGQAGVPVFVPPTSRDGREFLREIGFDRYLDGQGASREMDGRAGTIEMRQMAALDPTYVHQIADLLAERVPATSETTSHLIGLCLKELLQNVFEHAPDVPGAPVLCFVHTRGTRGNRTCGLPSWTPELASQGRCGVDKSGGYNVRRT